MNRAAVITGCTGGMGQVLSRRLAEKGYTLALTSNEPEKLTAQEKELQTVSRIFAKPADITSETEVAEFFREMGREIGEAAILINLAGLSLPAKIEEMPAEAFDRTLDVNLKGTYLACRFFAAQSQGDGLIVNIGSMAARRVNANAPVYCVAKSAVNTFSQGLSLQLAAKGIRVTTLNPGGADTPFWGDRPVNREKLLRASQVADIILYVLEADPGIVIHSIDFESFAALR